MDYYVSPEFKEGLFNSCKDVIYPGNNEKILSLLCGTFAAKCTPQKLLDFMGSTANGYAPFTINYKAKLAPNLTWMNETIFKCSQKFIDPRNNRTANPCSCQDCTASCPVPPPPLPTPTLETIFGLSIRTEQLIIRPTRNVPGGYKQFPYNNFVPFGPIFHLDLLNQVSL